jgi:hypothetical protein
MMRSSKAFFLLFACYLCSPVHLETEALADKPKKLSVAKQQIKTTRLKLTTIDVTLPKKLDENVRLTGSVQDAVNDETFTLFQAAVTTARERTFIFQASRVGTYQITFSVSGEKVEPVTVTVTVAADPVADPVKKDPATPPAKTAGLDEDLLRKFRDAVNTDVGTFGTAQKAHAAKLAALYSDIARQVRENPNPVPISVLSTQLHEAATESQIPRTGRGLTATRSVIASLEFDRFEENQSLVNGSHTKRVYVGLLQTAGTYLAVASAEPKKDTK